jgi:pSer/pThr/pTyr-binding forkhead associated (FHA) protein
MTATRATLRVLGPGEEKTEIPLTDRPLIIGREPDCDLIIADPAVSKRHAQLLVVDGQYMIRDQNSHNGTFVDGERITHRALKNGDVITIGAKKILFSVYEAPVQPGAITVAMPAGAAPPAVAIPIQMRPEAELTEAKLDELAQVEEKSRRIWSVLLTAAIVVTALIGLIIIFSLGGPTPIQIGVEEINLGIDEQLGQFSLPNAPYALNIRSLNPDIVEVDGRWPGDGQYDKDLSGLTTLYFARLRPRNEGEARIEIKRGNAVYFIVVFVRTYKEPDDYKKAMGEAKNSTLTADEKKVRAMDFKTRADSLLEAGLPGRAVQDYNVAREYLAAAGDVELMTKIEDKIGEARQLVKKQWDGLRLQMGQAWDRRDNAAMIEALEKAIQLFPDRDDARRQWAELVLKRFKMAEKKSAPGGIGSIQ